MPIRKPIRKPIRMPLVPRERRPASSPAVSSSPLDPWPAPLDPIPRTEPLGARGQLGDLLNAYDLLGEGVEVGVFRGEFAEKVLGRWRGRRWYLVDPIVRDEARQRLSSFGDRAVFHDVRSPAAADEFEDGSLDAVYIDADHRFTAVDADIRAWWPKVCPGGLLAGHDYVNSPDPPVRGVRPVPLDHEPSHPEPLPFAAKAAVDRFARELGLQVHASTDRDSSPSWFFFKPYRFVTTLEDSYVPGFLALVRSMLRRSGIEFAFTVILYGPLSDASHAAIDALGVSVEFVPKEALGTFQFPRHWTDTPRMAPNFDKILMWRLPYEETACYVDSDVLCLNSLRGIHRLRSLSVAIMQSSIEKGPDGDDAYRPSGMYPWNAGVMVFRPDPEIFEGIQRHARSYSGPVRYGDQVIQNDYFAEHRREMVRYVDLSWNMSTWISAKYTALFDPELVRFLHFAHEAKPWRDEPTYPWMRPFWDLWDNFPESGVPCCIAPAAR